MKAVILAGGAGSRLWPMSSSKLPKQFQALIGEKSMLQQTFARLDFLESQNIFIATNREFEDVVFEQIPNANIWIEPALRDTAACIGLAAIRIAKENPDEVMAIIYADHFIENIEEFQNKLKFAAKLAQEENTLNIIEVKARFPNTSLGYVEVNQPITAHEPHRVYGFEKFTEKPDQQKAEAFLQAGNFLWNTGLYVWKVSTILKQYQRFAPAIYEKLMQISQTLGTEQEAATLTEIYPQIERNSIDYAIMEKVEKEKVRIIEGDFNWDDVGTWEALHDVLEKNADQNLIKGQHLGLETENCLIYSEPNQLIATIGMKDVIIVQTKNALLVCNKKQSQDIKKLVELIKNKFPEQI